MGKQKKSGEDEVREVNGVPEEVEGDDGPNFDRWSNALVTPIEKQLGTVEQRSKPGKQQAAGGTFSSLGARQFFKRGSLFFFCGAPRSSMSVLTFLHNEKVPSAALINANLVWISAHVAMNASRPLLFRTSDHRRSDWQRCRLWRLRRLWPTKET
jgi:hypothetical protein